MSKTILGEALELTQQDRATFEAANIRSAGPRSVELDSKVRCPQCRRTYLAYWIGNRFFMRQEDSALCQCGEILVRWNDTSDMSLLQI